MHCKNIYICMALIAYFIDKGRSIRKLVALFSHLNFTFWVYLWNSSTKVVLCSTIQLWGMKRLQFPERLHFYDKYLMISYRVPGIVKLPFIVWWTKQRWFFICWSFSLVKVIRSFHMYYLIPSSNQLHEVIKYHMWFIFQ